MTYFLALPYTPHKAAPQFVELCFRFVQTTVFPILSSLLLFIMNRSQTFISVYKLYFILAQNV